MPENAFIISVLVFTIIFGSVWVYANLQLTQGREISKLLETCYYVDMLRCIVRNPSAHEDIFPIFDKVVYRLASDDDYTYVGSGLRFICSQRLSITGGDDGYGFCTYRNGRQINVSTNYVLDAIMHEADRLPSPYFLFLYQVYRGIF